MGQPSFPERFLGVGMTWDVYGVESKATGLATILPRGNAEVDNNGDGPGLLRES